MKKELSIENQNKIKKSIIQLEEQLDATNKSADRVLKNPKTSKIMSGFIVGVVGIMNSISLIILKRYNKKLETLI